MKLSLAVEIKKSERGKNQPDLHCKTRFLFFWLFVSNCYRRVGNTNKTSQVRVTHRSFVRVEQEWKLIDFFACPKFREVTKHKCNRQEQSVVERCKMNLCSNNWLQASNTKQKQGNFSFTLKKLFFHLKMIFLTSTMASERMSLHSLFPKMASERIIYVEILTKVNALRNSQTSPLWKSFEPSFKLQTSKTQQPIKLCRYRSFYHRLFISNSSS